MSVVATENHGALVISSSYWGSAYDRAGKVYASVNAGAVRLLLPQNGRLIVQECRTSTYAVLSRGPWPAQGLPEAVEIMFEDGSDSPYALHLSPESFDVLPAEPGPGEAWTLSMWLLKKGKPHKALERRCHWRRVKQLPWMKPWGGE